MKIIKVSILFILLLSLVSCGKNNDVNTKIAENNVNNISESVGDNNVNEENTKQVEENQGEYGDLTEYIDRDISEEKKTELGQVLLDRKDRQALIKEKLTKALEEGNIEDVFDEVKTMRDACAARLGAYVAKDKLDDFKKYCDSLDKKMKEKYKSGNIEEEDIKIVEKKDVLEKSPIEDIRIYNGK